MFFIQGAHIPKMFFREALQNENSLKHLKLKVKSMRPFTYSKKEDTPVK